MMNALFCITSNMKKKFNIIIRKEWKNFVTRVIENNVSSFWTTKEEALKNTYEALELYCEQEKNLTNYRISKPSLLEYSLANA